MNYFAKYLWTVGCGPGMKNPDPVKKVRIRISNTEYSISKTSPFAEIRVFLISDN
jgi:hypothetical protein